MYDHLCSKAEETTSRKNTPNPKMNVQLLKVKAGQSPLLASAHESSCIRLWSIQVANSLGRGWNIEKIIPLIFGKLLFN